MLSVSSQAASWAISLRLQYGVSRIRGLAGLRSFCLRLSLVLLAWRSCFAIGTSYSAWRCFDHAQRAIEVLSRGDVSCTRMLSEREKDALAPYLEIILGAGEPLALLGALRRVAELKAHQVLRVHASSEDEGVAAEWLALAEALTEVGDRICARSNVIPIAPRARNIRRPLI